MKTGGSVFALGGLAACGGGGGAADTQPNASISVPLEAPVPKAPTVPTAPGSAGVNGPPPATDIRYRTQHGRLFQSLAGSTLPSRLAGGSSYHLEMNGPTHDYVDLRVGWRWRNRGGDWLDADSTAQGDRPWFSVATDAVIGNRASHDYSVDVSAALKFVQTTGRWCAFRLRSAGAPRVIAGLHQPPPQAHPLPRIDVRYQDGSSESLSCLLIGGLASGAQLPLTTAPQYSLPVVIEFARPARAVSSATLSFTVVEHWSGMNKHIEGFVLDPQPVVPTPRPGIASSAGLLDAALDQEDAIIGVHRYLDGAPWSDFASIGRDPLIYNTGAERNFDPAIFATGPTDQSKFPHLDLGKWIGVGGNWSKVESAYRGQGFAPLAPGLGAVKVDMPAAPGIGNGAEVGYGGTLAANAVLYLPEPDFGRLKRLFVRYYLRFAPYVASHAKRYQVLQAGVPVWTDLTGKIGIAPSHVTSYGGVSGSSGMGYGWQMRLGWADCDAEQGGPDERGLALGLHTYDFLDNNSPFIYGRTDTPHDTQFGQQGGFGAILYHDKWYCIEMEVDLNSVTQSAPGYLQDGAIRVWIDGSLAFERTQMVLRSLPAYSAPYISTRLRPCRELGHRDLWFNWFHGGKTANTIDRTVFFTGVAWGRDYIGPMKLA